MISRLLDRGIEIMTIFPEVTVTNARGEKMKLPDEANPVTIKVSASTDRQSDAELTGQVSNKVLNILTRHAPVGSWARVIFRGEEWDLAAPPVWQQSMSPRVKHVEFTIRSRNQKL